MKYTPVTEEEANKARHRLIPDGDYDFEIVKAEDATTKKSGEPMLKIQLKIFCEESERMLTDFIVLNESWSWKLRHLCQSVGLMKFYEAGTLQNHHLEGKSGWVKIGHSKRKDTGEVQNGVKDYTFETVVDAGKKAEKAAPVDDDVPF